MNAIDSNRVPGTIIETLCARKSGAAKVELQRAAAFEPGPLICALQMGDACGAFAQGCAAVKACKARVGEVAWVAREVILAVQKLAVQACAAPNTTRAAVRRMLESTVAFLSSLNAESALPQDTILSACRSASDGVERAVARALATICVADGVLQLADAVEALAAADTAWTLTLLGPGAPAPDRAEGLCDAGTSARTAVGMLLQQGGVKVEMLAAQLYTLLGNGEQSSSALAALVAYDPLRTACLRNARELVRAIEKAGGSRGTSHNQLVCASALPCALTLVDSLGRGCLVHDLDPAVRTAELLGELHPAAFAWQAIEIALLHQARVSSLLAGGTGPGHVAQAQSTTDRRLGALLLATLASRPDGAAFVAELAMRHGREVEAELLRNIRTILSDTSTVDLKAALASRGDVPLPSWRRTVKQEPLSVERGVIDLALLCYVRKHHGADVRGKLTQDLVQQLKALGTLDTPPPASAVWVRLGMLLPMIAGVLAEKSARGSVRRTLASSLLRLAAVAADGTNAEARDGGPISGSISLLDWIVALLHAAIGSAGWPEWLSVNTSRTVSLVESLNELRQELPAGSGEVRDRLLAAFPTFASNSAEHGDPWLLLEPTAGSMAPPWLQGASVLARSRDDESDDDHELEWL